MSDSDSDSEGLVPLLEVDVDDMPEFSADYDFPELPPNLNVFTAEIGQAIELGVAAKESYYQQFYIAVEHNVVDDDTTGYTAEIRLHLGTIANALRLRRTRRCRNFLAIREFGVIPPVVNLGMNVDLILGFESNEVNGLKAQEEVQIKTAAEYDVALFLIRGNVNRLHLPIFLIASPAIFGDLILMARGSYRALRKSDAGIWNRDLLFEGGVALEEEEQGGGVALEEGGEAQEGGGVALEEEEQGGGVALEGGGEAQEEEEEEEEEQEEEEEEEEEEEAQEEAQEEEEEEEEEAQEGGEEEGEGEEAQEGGEEAEEISVGDGAPKVEDSDSNSGSEDR